MYQRCYVMSEMKMAIVYGDISTTHQLIIERAQELFDTVLAVPIDGLKFVHTEDEQKILYKETDLTSFDAVYIRTGDKDKLFSEHLAEVLNEEDVFTQAENDTYAYEAHKFYSMKILGENGVKVPDSVYTLSPDAAIEAASRLGYPVIMKLIRGGGGTGVMRATSENELKPVMDTMQALKQDICLQEYKEHDGTDNRVIVIGDYITAYSRSSSGDEWRSNISEGGERLESNLTEEMKEMAFISARSTGFDICGNDIINIDDGVYVLEVNGAFGLNDELNELLGEDLIMRVVERMHEQAAERKNDLS